MDWAINCDNDHQMNESNRQLLAHDSCVWLTLTVSNSMPQIIAIHSSYCEILRLHANINMSISRVVTDDWVKANWQKAT